MDRLADALAYAVSYLASRTGDDIDDDLQALEWISYLLRDATDAEKDAIEAAAKRLIADAADDEIRTAAHELIENIRISG